nr:hypothetical protein [Tanacetum cinerariifolium]
MFDAMQVLIFKVEKLSWLERSRKCDGEYERRSRSTRRRKMSDPTLDGYTLHDRIKRPGEVSVKIKATVAGCLQLHIADKVINGCHAIERRRRSGGDDDGERNRSEDE